jgi:CheY-like chemotaxis protein
MVAMSASFSEPPTVTVLVVDNEPFIRVVIAEALGEAGYFAVEAENADVALDLLHADSSIDILITDMHLLGALDGHQLALKAYSIFPALKVIFMTGDDVAASRITKQPGLADGVLVKPFRLEELWQMVEVCLRAQ